MVSNVEELRSPMVGTVVWVAAEGQPLVAGATAVLLESMKMEHAVTVERDGVVASVEIEVGSSIDKGQLLLHLGAPKAAQASVPEGSAPPSTAQVRLEELHQRISLLHDAARPEAVAKRHALGLRTARENLEDLVDPGSFVEYGRFAYAAQTKRRAVDELIRATPADGLIGGIATINAAQFGAEASACAVVSYDYTVLAGTQGQRNHHKKDRLFEVVQRMGLPVVLFAEGGGGRPGDTDHPVVTGLNTGAFAAFAALSGQVPTIGIAAGRCFAGNAALLGTCDVVIATRGASIGMGGPAMIEGGGLGVVDADEVGPAPMHYAAGSVDVLVEDEAEAVAVAKQLLGYIQGSVAPTEPANQQDLAATLPADRRRAYDVQGLLEVLFDPGSLLELRGGFGRSVVTALARLEGRAVGVLASNPIHLAGAVDADAADKAARFCQLLEARGLPLISLVDTPGFMVGVDAERTGLVRHVSRLFVAAAAMTVPIVAVITRRGYGLGAQALCGGSFEVPLRTVAWPQAELGGMGLEGAVRLGFRRELEAIADPAERAAAFEHMVDAAYEHGRALNVAAHLELDDVIDPATTRNELLAVLSAAPERLRAQPAGRFIDTW